MLCNPFGNVLTPERAQLGRYAVVMGTQVVPATGTAAIDWLADTECDGITLCDFMGSRVPIDPVQQRLLEITDVRKGVRDIVLNGGRALNFSTWNTWGIGDGNGGSVRRDPHCWPVPLQCRGGERLNYALRNDAVAPSTVHWAQQGYTRLRHHHPYYSQLDAIAWLDEPAVVTGEVTLGAAGTPTAQGRIQLTMNSEWGVAIDRVQVYMSNDTTNAPNFYTETVLMTHLKVGQSSTDSVLYQATAQAPASVAMWAAPYTVLAAATYREGWGYNYLPHPMMLFPNNVLDLGLQNTGALPAPRIRLVVEGRYIEPNCRR